MADQVLMTRPDGGKDGVLVNSAVYNCPAGVPVLVPRPYKAEDISTSTINTLIRDAKWLLVSPGLAGPTSARPQSPTVGQWYTDTTLGLHLVYYGSISNWCNSISGAPNQ